MDDLAYHVLRVASVADGGYCSSCIGGCFREACEQFPAITIDQWMEAAKRIDAENNDTEWFGEPHPGYLAHLINESSGRTQ